MLDDCSPAVSIKKGCQRQHRAEIEELFERWDYRCKDYLGWQKGALTVSLFNKQVDEGVD